MKDTEETTGQPADAARQPDWWHRDHPTFTALSGFFTGLVLACLGPGLYLSVLDAVLEPATVEELFPLVLVFLAVPIVLVAVPGTRRFGQYMLLGVLITALIVLGVASLVIWLMMRMEA